MWVCKERVELERLKDKMAHEKEKEDLHQQVENVVSQMEVLHVQMHGKLLIKMKILLSLI